MKQLRKSDLKEGEIYKADGNINSYIFKATNNLENVINITSYKIFFKSGNFNKGFLIFSETTPEEKHWLEVCIKVNKFVSYEEAMKTFKKPEFVLPEIWWVRITKENLEDVCKFLSFTPYEKAIGYITGMVKHYRTGKIEKGWNDTPTTVYGSTFGDEITTEQFRKYVLKKEPVVFEEPKDTVLQLNQIRGKGTTIVQVQCSEGGIYKIGDKITVFDKTSPNKGKPFTIQGFRWNNAKTKLCAVTELHTPNGIGLDKIELYVEPKQELSLLEQAKLKYPVGTKIISPTSKSTHTIKGDIRYGYQNSCVYNFIFGNDGGCTLYNADTNQWAEIVEDFVLPEKWCIKDVKEVKEFFENYNYGNYSCHNIAYLHYPKIRDYCYFETIQKDYTEITLEQFKKYVLNEKV